ncbi:hypothetical protein [Cupriavidus sp. H18C1]|uniref:hypothetical protein n=1 Tax=Cupriavidus sp. H18C1 TaxID=3241601 RepID=UPI003BB87FE1
MVSIGLRTESPDLQMEWAQQVLASSAPDSADRGAALAILAYRLLDKQPAGDAEQLCAEIQKYVSIPPRNPNARRWAISLNYVLALLHLEMGRRAEAAVALAAVLRDNPAEYSVTLVTKAVDAAWLLGSMHLADGKQELAREIWRNEGLRWMRAVGAHMTSVSDQYDPPTFEPREMASVVRKIGRLFAGGKFADLAQSHPSVYQAEIEEEAFATQMRIDAMADERKRMAAEIKELRAYLDAVLDGKAWLEENRARTIAYVEDLEASLRDRDAEVASLQAENQSLADGKKWLEEHRVRTMTYVEQLEASLRDRDAEVAGLHAENRLLADGKKWLEENRLRTMAYVEKLEASLRESTEDSASPTLAAPESQKPAPDDK